jgi:(p)ppGpp synthase/HD superfamily hydrolase
MPSLDDAILLATRVHHGQVDRAGAPYILHPLRVLVQVDSQLERTVAVLHDVVEETELTLEHLRALGYAESVVYAVDCLSRRPGESYEELIERAKLDPVALRVKLADLRDHMDFFRLPAPLTDDDFQRFQRYQKAWKNLTAVSRCG